MQTPLVSISFVAYNAEPFICEALESCLMQKVDFPYEIIIHDDASQDRTPQIIKEYAQKYPDKIVPILQRENQFSQGVEIISKYIFPKAKGKYIAFLEADDYWTNPEKLSYQVEFLESHPSVSMCFTASEHFYIQNKKKKHIKRYRNCDSVCSEKDVILRGGRILDMVSVMARMSVFNDLPHWFSYTYLWDVTVPLLSLLHGNIYYLDKITSVYRYGVPGSWTQNNVKYTERRKANIDKILNLYDAFDDFTDHQYHKLINRKLNSLTVSRLLLSNKDSKNFNDFYSKLNFSKKLEYQIFNILGSFRLYERYKQFKRLLNIY